MKVLMINSVPTDKNGVTNVIMNLIKNIDHDKLIIDLLCINEPQREYKEIVELQGGKIIKLKRSIKHPFLYIYQLKNIIKNEHYAIVHAHGNSHSLALEMVAAKMAGCKVRISHSHSTFCRYRLIHLLMSPFFFASCTYGIACGINAGKWMFGKKQYLVINNGIDLERFRFDREVRKRIRDDLGIADNVLLIGHVGDFNTDNKNQKFAIEVAEKLHSINNRFHFLMIGDGNLRKEYEKKIKLLEEDYYIHFVGLIDNVNEYLSAFDLFILPSMFEGLPLSGIEAQAAGLVCLVSDKITKAVDITGNVQFLSIDNGITEWVEQICKRTYEDRDSMSKRACESISKNGFNINEESRKLKRIYMDLYKRANI